MTEITGEKCLLRSWRLDDKEELIRQANTRKIADNLRDAFPHPYTTLDAENWVNSAVNSQDKLLVIEVDHKLAGSIGFHIMGDVYRKNAEMGYWLGVRYWNRGIISEAVVLITGYIFEHFNIHRVFSEPFADNTGSRRVLEKAGFRCEAHFRENVIKNNVMKDSCIYAILRDEWQSKSKKFK